MANAKDKAGEIPVIPAGLVLIGTLSGRRRRPVVGKDGSKRYCHTLSVKGEEDTQRIDIWSDEALPAMIPTVGDKVALPVRVRVFNSSVGPQHRLVLAEADSGESY